MTVAPRNPRRPAAWNPSTAFAVTQMRSCGTIASTSVQADEQVPSMTICSPASRSAIYRDQYAPMLPPWSSVMRTMAVAVVSSRVFNSAARTNENPRNAIAGARLPFGRPLLGRMNFLEFSKLLFPTGSGSAVLAHVDPARFVPCR